MKSDSFYNFLSGGFMVAVVASVQYFALIGSGRDVTLDAYLSGSAGNAFSWCAVTLFLLWSFAWLYLHDGTVEGTVGNDGVKTKFKDNGTCYYFCTVAVYLVLQYLYPSLSTLLFKWTPEILGTCNIYGFVFSTYLYFSSNKGNDMPAVYRFYMGRERSPTMFGVDAKQLVNSRFGMMSWQILVLAYISALYSESGSFNLPAFISFALQSVYAAKFFTTEKFYLNSLDVTMDHAGFYLIWGCFVWLPGFYSYPSYYFVRYPPTTGALACQICAVIGLTAIFLQAQTDSQKNLIKSTNGNCLIWGKKPTFIKAKYVLESTKEVKTSLLLTSGFWGLARHLNYTLEMVYTMAFTYPGITMGFSPNTFAIFMFALLIHRAARDDEKNKMKYGKYWNEYCKKVPYVYIPYLI